MIQTRHREAMNVGHRHLFLSAVAGLRNHGVSAQPAAVTAAGGVRIRNKERRSGSAPFPEGAQVAAVLQGKFLPRRAVSRDGAGSHVLVRRQQRAAGWGCGDGRSRRGLLLFHHQRPVLRFACRTLRQRGTGRIVERPAKLIHFAALVFQQGAKTRHKVLQHGDVFLTIRHNAQRHLWLTPALRRVVFDVVDPDIQLLRRRLHDAEILSLRGGGDRQKCQTR